MSDPDAAVPQVLTNVGLVVAPTDGFPTDLGPLVVVANYANANSAVGDHFDRFVVGTVWEDLDADGRYDAGEGVGGVTVTIAPGDWFADHGGRRRLRDSRPRARHAAGELRGGGVPPHRTQVEVGAQSVLADYVVPEPRRRSAPHGGGSRRTARPRRSGRRAAARGRMRAPALEHDAAGGDQADRLGHQPALGGLDAGGEGVGGVVVAHRHGFLQQDRAVVVVVVDEVHRRAAHLHAAPRARPRGRGGRRSRGRRRPGSAPDAR